MPEVIQKSKDEAFVFSLANGTLSRGTGKLAQSDTIYESGSVVVLIGTEYVLATAALIDDVDNADADVSIVARRKDCRTGARQVALITRLAEVKEAELIVGAATTIEDVRAALAKKFVQILSSN